MFSPRKFLAHCRQRVNSSTMSSIPLYPARPCTTLTDDKQDCKKGKKNWNGTSLETASKSFLNFMTKLVYFY